MKKIIIIGAGPAGLTTGYLLTKKKFSVDVYEITDDVGGMARSLQLWGQTVDLGPHRFFSNDRRVNEIWLQAVKNDYDMVNRLTRIYYNKRFFDYPIKPVNALLNLGFFEAIHCVFSYFISKKIDPSHPESFESWVTSRFGKRLYEIFFKTYSEKLWGIPCTTLDADFAAQRIKKFSLGEALKNAFLPGSGKHKTLVDQFAYPHQGSGSVYRNMKDEILSSGNHVYLNTPVKRIIIKDDKATGVELADGSIAGADAVLSSMPLTAAINGLDNVPADILDASSKLFYRNTILVFLKIDHNKLFPDNWLYIHSPGLQMGRITNFRNWLPSLYNKSPFTILAVEYWCYDHDLLWKTEDKEIIRMASDETARTGLLKNAAVLDGYVYRLHCSYPVYNIGYKKHLQKVTDYLDQFTNIYFAGRYGAFKYNNQDHSILMGLLAAENIEHGYRKHNLWDVNTDYDSYQESAIITKTGLQKTT